MIARICESCGVTLSGDDVYIDVMLEAKRADKGPTQDAEAQIYGDFCIPCVKNGVATRLLAGRLIDRKQADGPDIGGDVPGGGAP